MKKILCALLFFLSTALLSESVAIIGAGPAGLAAAEKLQTAGYSVTVFEKESRVGGKCFSIDCESGHGIVELGAVQVGIGYPVVNRYVEETGLHLRDYWGQYSLRWNDGVRAPIYKTLAEEYWPTKDYRAIGSELITMQRALKRFAPINDSGFTNFPADSEFRLSLEDWTNSLGLNHFKEDYRVWMTSYGYGLLSEVPAFLALNLINSSYGLFLMRSKNMNLRMVAEGYGGLMKSMVSHYGLHVENDVLLTDVKRSDREVVLSYRQGKNMVRDVRFDHLVIACGLSCAEEFLAPDEMSVEEKSLLNDLVYSPYDVVIATVPQLPKGGYVVPQHLHEHGHVSLISKNSSGGDEVILWVPRGGLSSLKNPLPRPSFAELTNIVREDMARAGLNVEKIVTVKYWDNYFPHFQNADSYGLLDYIQGRNRTVYVGSIARFEIVERAMSHAHDTVQQHIMHESLDGEPGYLQSAAMNMQSLMRYVYSMNKEDDVR